MAESFPNIAVIIFSQLIKKTFSRFNFSLMVNSLDEKFSILFDKNGFYNQYFY